MKLSILLITTLALCTFFGASAQPFGIDTMENMQKKKSSCIELSEEKEEEITIIVQKLTDHLRQVMQEHKNFDFKLIKLNIEEHKDTHTTENDTVLQLIVNDCARENEDDTKTDEKLNRSSITKVEPKNDDEVAKRHDLSSNDTTVGIKDSKIQPNHAYNNQPTDLTKNKEQPSKLNDFLLPSFSHGEANLDKKPSITNLTDSKKPSNNHGPNFGKKPLATDKKETVLNGSKKSNENIDKLNDTKKPLFINHQPNVEKKPIATDRRDNVTSDPKKKNENIDILKDTIQPLSNNRGPNFTIQPLATDKKDNVTNSSNKDSENTDNLKDTVKSPFNKDAMPDKNNDIKLGEIDKKKDVIEDKQNKTTEEKNIEKETKKPEIEPKINQKNETHSEIKKNEDKKNVTKPKNDKRNEEQMKKPGTHKNETQADDNRDKKLTQLKLPENAEKLLRALEKNQPKGKPFWIYLGDKEENKNIVFF